MIIFLKVTYCMVMRVIPLLLSNKLAEATSYSACTVKLIIEQAKKA